MEDEPFEYEIIKHNGKNIAIFTSANPDWEPAHLFTDAEKAENERMEAAKRKAKK